MKKNYLCSFLLVPLMVVASKNGICFAESDGSQAYTEAQADIAKLNQPIVCDKDYLQGGFRTHSWITENGSKTVAYTQIINTDTGAVISEIERQCNYTDPVYDIGN